MRTGTILYSSCCQHYHIPIRLVRLFSSATSKVGTSNVSRPQPTLLPAVALGDGIKLQKVGETAENNDGRTLAIVAGWMHSTERQLKPYLNFYHSRGIDTLSYSVGMGHILRPTTAMDHMKKVLDETASLDPERVVFHNFSVGGFLCGQALRIVASEPETHRSAVAEKVGAQVYDSPPDMAGIPEGLASHVFPQGEEKNAYQRFFHSAIRSTVEGYIALTKNTEVGVHHRASSEAFHNNFLRAPSLWYYSLSDPIANYKDCQTVIETWRQNGISVDECVWEESPHIQHGRLDPERYFTTLDQFLIKHGVIIQQQQEKEPKQQQEQQEKSLPVLENEKEKEDETEKEDDNQNEERKDSEAA